MRFVWLKRNLFSNSLNVIVRARTVLKYWFVGYYRIDENNTRKIPVLGGGLARNQGPGNFVEKGPQKSNKLPFNSNIKKNITIFEGPTRQSIAWYRPASPPLPVPL